MAEFEGYVQTKGGGRNGRLLCSPRYGRLLWGNPSFTPRGIWVARSLINTGLRWRIGDGEKVCIWEDRWIPRPLTFKVISPLPNDASVT